MPLSSARTPVSLALLVAFFAPAAEAGGPCKVDMDCPGREECENGQCHLPGVPVQGAPTPPAAAPSGSGKNCLDDAECPLQETCMGSRCVTRAQPAGPPAASGPPPSVCQRSDDCHGDLICVQGACVPPAAQAQASKCAEDRDCSGGMRCVDHRCAQGDDDALVSPAAVALWAEFGGIGFLSANFEVALGRSATLSTGVGPGVRLKSAGEPDFGDDKAPVTVPLRAHFFVAGNNSRFELVAASAIIPGKRGGFAVGGGLGYRYQPVKGGFSFRVGALAVDYSLDGGDLPLPLPYLSFGGAF